MRYLNKKPCISVDFVNNLMVRCQFYLELFFVAEKCFFLLSVTDNVQIVSFSLEVYSFFLIRKKNPLPEKSFQI